MIFKRVGEERPYPEHGYTQRQWAQIAPQQVRLDQLVTTRRWLDLEALLEEDSRVIWRASLWLSYTSWGSWAT